MPRSRLARAALIALGCVVVLLGIARLALPSVAHRLIESQGSAALGVALELEELEVSLFEGQVRALGISLPSLPQASLGELALDLDWRAVARQEIGFTSIQLAGLRVMLERAADGGISLAGYQPPPADASAEDATSETESAALPPVLLAVSRLSDLELSLRDAGTGEAVARLALADLTLDELTFVDGKLELAGVAFSEPRITLSSLAGSAESSGEPSAVASAESPQATTAPAESATATTEPAVAEPAPEAFALHIKELAIRDGSLRLPARGEPLAVALELSLRDLDLAPASRWPIDLRLKLEPGEIHVKGEIAPSPLAFSLELEWSELDLPRLLTAVPGDEPPVELPSGRSRGSLRLELAAANGAALEVTGELGLASLELATGSGKGRSEVAAKEIVFAIERAAVPLAPVAGVTPPMSLAGKISLTELRFDAGAGSDHAKGEIAQITLGIENAAIPLGGEGAPEIALGRLALQAPRVHYTRSAAPAASAVAPSAELPADSGAPSPRLKLASFELSAGNLIVDDRSVAEARKSEITDLAITAKDLRWPELEVAHAEMTGAVASGGALSAKGNYRGGKGDFALALRELALVPFAPYARDAGYQLERGRLTLAVDGKVIGERIDLTNDVELHRLGLSGGEGAIQKAIGMPLPVALALLSDPKGRIRIKAPLEIDGGKTSVELLPVLQAALRQALVGALSSPLKAIGLLLPAAMGGSGKPDTNALEFTAGSAELSPEARERLTKLSELLLASSKLRVEVRGGIGDEDRAVLADAQALSGLAQQRASAVRTAMVSEYGVPGDQLAVGLEAELPGVTLQLLPDS